MKPKTTTTSTETLKNTSDGKKTWLDLLFEEAKQFCLNTALHGYRFIVLPKRILLERVIWTVICLASLIAALTLLFIAWFSFQKNPIVSVTDSTHHPIWNYEFPAVTICDYNKISRKKAIQMAKNFTVKNGRSPKELSWDIRLLFQLINNDNPQIPLENYTRLNNLLKDNGISVDEALRTLAPTCEEILLRCKWKGEEKRCEGIFEQIRTSDGFCCSFNYFAVTNHSFSGTFANKAAKRPRRVSACGYQTGLEVLVDNKPEDYFATHIPSLGYRVLVHSPHYFPDNNLQNIMINMRSLNLIGVNPKLTYTTAEFKNLPVSVRFCYYSEEGKLIKNTRSNYHNCMVACRMEMIIKFCRCVPYQYLQFDDSNQIVCSPEDIPCLSEFEKSLDRSMSEMNISGMNSLEGYSWESRDCSCLPDCELTEYLSETSTGILSRRYSVNDYALYGRISIKNQSVIRVFYSDLVAIRTRWDVVFNWHTLLAYYGGLLGLFVGFSFVSGLEIIYFFTVRLLVDAVKNKPPQVEPGKMTKRGRKSKIVVHPVTYQNLDPSRLIIPSDAELRRYRMNSYFFN